MRSYIDALVARLRAGYESELARVYDKVQKGVASGALTEADAAEIRAAAWATPDVPDAAPTEPEPAPRPQVQPVAESEDVT